MRYFGLLITVSLRLDDYAIGLISRIYNKNAKQIQKKLELGHRKNALSLLVFIRKNTALEDLWKLCNCKQFPPISNKTCVLACDGFRLFTNQN